MGVSPHTDEYLISTFGKNNVLSSYIAEYKRTKIESINY